MKDLVWLVVLSALLLAVLVHLYLIQYEGADYLQEQAVWLSVIAGAVFLSRLAWPQGVAKKGDTHDEAD